MTPHTQTAHTPGPWTSERTGDGKAYIIGNRQSAWGTHVAEVYADDTDRDEAKANAALIQHAPDLLAACQALLKVADSCNRFAEEMASHEWTRYLEATELARAAIAHANA